MAEQPSTCAVRRLELTCRPLASAASGTFYPLTPWLPAVGAAQLELTPELVPWEPMTSTTAKSSAAAPDHDGAGSAP